MVAGTSASSTSSASHVIASAGAPAIIAPCTARNAVSCGALCASGSAKPTRVAASAEMIRMRPRPYFSERMEKGTTHNANTPVAADTLSAATEGDTSSCWLSVGSSA